MLYCGHFLENYDNSYIFRLTFTIIISLINVMNIFLNLLRLVIGNFLLKLLFYLCLLLSRSDGF